VGRSYRAVFSDCNVTGRIIGTDGIGGLAGQADAGSISRCFFAGDVNGVESIGGLVGIGGRWIYIPGYGMDDIPGPTISESSAQGTVTGVDDCIGGMVGSTVKGKISGCWCESIVSGEIGSSVGGLVGGSSSQVSTCRFGGEVYGYRVTGGLVGSNSGSISGSCCTASVSGDRGVGGLVGTATEDSSISDCNFSGAVMGEETIGGLIGMNYGRVSGSWCSAAVEGETDYIGGLIGVSQDTGDVSNCYAVGTTRGDDIVGGLVGYNVGSISNCYATGSVNGWGDVGGLVGANSSGSIGLIEGGTIDNVVGLGTPDMTIEATFTSAGWDFIGETANGTEDVWAMPVTAYPQFTRTFTLQGLGSEDNPYRIRNSFEFDLFGAKPEYWDDHIRLQCDVDLSGRTYPDAVIAPYPIPPPPGAEVPSFTGVFDGNGHRIVGLTIDAVGAGRIYVALFGQMDGATVKSLGVEDVHISTDYHAGAIVGDNDGGTISQCYSTGYVEGGTEVGGLASNSTQRSWIPEIAVVTNCYSTTTVSGTGRVGGLLGHNSGTVSNCYSTGDVAGDEYVGGLIGRNGRDQAITNCFWDTETQRHGVAVGIGEDYGEAEDVQGLSTAAMQTLNTFTSATWDFVGEPDNGTEDIWTVCQGTNYPRFAWQVLPSDILCPDGVNFIDYSFFASNWSDDDCADSNDCHGTDFNQSGRVDANDLAIFLEDWLVGCESFLPSRASYPNPHDGAVGIRTDPVLSWTSGAYATSHDIYFGTADPPELQINQAAATFDPRPLANETRYYWRIDEVGPGGTTTGAVWSFTTESSGGTR